MSILSTHSGHHRIFIGPVVQKQNANNVDEPTANPTTPSPTGTHHNHQQQQHSHLHHNSHHNSSSAPKPWWEGSSFLRSRLSLSHYPTPPPSGSSKAHSDVDHGPIETTSPVITEPSSPDSPLAQTSIPQFSYTFSDDNDSERLSDDLEDEDDDLYDSEDEQRDYEHDRDESDSDEDQRDHSSTNSSESLSDPVGHSQDISEESGRMQSQATTGTHSHPYPIHPQDAASFNQIQRDKKQQEKIKRKDKDKGKDKEGPSTHGGSRWTSTKTKGKRRTRSMRDEGEPNRFKKMLGTFRDKTHHQGRLDNPDLGWESDGSR